MIIKEERYLQHFGVLGMRWGKRKQQPSSFRSSVLAGSYAATGKERTGKALDKSNDKDAKRWEKAKVKYKQQPMDAARRAKVMKKGKVVTKRLAQHLLINAATDLTAAPYIAVGATATPLLIGVVGGAFLAKNLMDGVKEYKAQQ